MRPLRRSVVHNSNPFMPGSMMSRTMRCGRNVRAAPTASEPSATTCTSNPSNARFSRSSVDRFASSSTTRIRLFIGGRLNFSTRYSTGAMLGAGPSCVPIATDRLTVALALGVCVCVGLLGWAGYHADLGVAAPVDCLRHPALGRDGGSAVRSRAPGHGRLSGLGAQLPGVASVPSETAARAERVRGERVRALSVSRDTLRVAARRWARQCRVLLSHRAPAGLAGRSRRQRSFFPIAHPARSRRAHRPCCRRSPDAAAHSRRIGAVTTTRSAACLTRSCSSSSTATSIGRTCLSWSDSRSTSTGSGGNTSPVSSTKSGAFDQGNTGEFGLAIADPTGALGRRGHRPQDRSSGPAPRIRPGLSSIPTPAVLRRSRAASGSLAGRGGTRAKFVALSGRVGGRHRARGRRAHPR